MVLRRDRERPLGECVVRHEVRFGHFALLGAGLLLRLAVLEAFAQYRTGRSPIRFAVLLAAPGRKSSTHSRRRMLPIPS